MWEGDLSRVISSILVAERPDIHNWTYCETKIQSTISFPPSLLENILEGLIHANAWTKDES